MSYVRGEADRGIYEMKVDSENMVPSSVTSVSPIFSFSESFSCGQY